MFEKATRQKVRFDTEKGSISTEDLWDLPLRSKSSFDLDSIAIRLHKQLKETDEISFVNTPVESKRTAINLKFDIVRHVIEVKLEEEKKRETAASTKAQKEYLLKILDEKQNEELKGKSTEEIKAELAKLEAQ